MADTFFGFDTSTPFDNDGGSGLDELDDYDALNDETFGSAINDDWEGEHENLVLLDSNGNSSRKEKDLTDDGDLGDLDFSIARMGLEDCEEVDDDIEGRVQLDPSVWSIRGRNDDPFNKQFNGMMPPENFMPHLLTMPNAMNMAGPSIVNPFQHQMANQAQQQHQQQQQQQQQQHLLNASRQPNVPPKIMSVEDLERRMHQKSDTTMKPPTPQNVHQRPNVQQPFPQPLAQTSKGQSLFASHSNTQNDLQKNPNQRIPMGFPANMMVPPHMNVQTTQMHPSLTRGPPNVSMPMNNFNVNAMRTATPTTPIIQMHQKQMQQSQTMTQPPPSAMQSPAQQGSQQQQHKRPGVGMMPPHMQLPQFQTPQQQSVSVNQFNKRLVHEIQQNHPMLFNAKHNNKGNNTFPFGMKGGHIGGALPGGGIGHHHPNMQYHHQPHQHRNNNNNNNNNSSNNSNNNNNTNNNNGNNNNNMHQNRMMNGTLEYDKYANLMSQRDKQWLIGIQLSQLNTGTPYIDDFYYTVFRERKAKLKGIKENKAHKDNQLNHPLIQPKGHAQLVLISMGNKNGTNQQRNQRERKNSESGGGKDKETPRTYTPLQFENSLGKLQCGSVTAPRKIIDMDVVGADTGSPMNSTIEISTQRKSRQILLHIETLYRIALKLEDLEDPTAIATALIVKERKEKERLLAAEQERLNELANSEGKDGADFVSSVSRSSSSLSADKEETREELLEKLFAGLTHEKVAQMMTIRKGKTLIKRILPLIKDSPYRWDVWIAILAALPLLVKKDRDDAENPLFILFPEFQSYIENASIDSILRLTNTLISCEKLNYIFTNKFSISCVIVLLVKMESVYAISPNAISQIQQASWLEFLTALVNAADKLENLQLANVAYENDILKPLLNHFSRFRDLKSQTLIAVLTQRNS